MAASERESVAAIVAATEAQALAKRADDPQLCALADGMAAIAYAVAGLHKSSMLACDSAREHIARAGEGCPLSPAYWVTPAVVESQYSNCLLLLGAYGPAAEGAASALARIAPARTGTRMACTLRLARAYVGDEEVEAAARAVADVAILAMHRRSERTARELRSTRAQLQRWAGSPIIRDLDEQLAAFGFLPLRSA